MRTPDVKELTLPCEECNVLVDVWCEADDYLDGKVRVRCPSHRTPTSTP